VVAAVSQLNAAGHNLSNNRKWHPQLHHILTILEVTLLLLCCRLLIRTGTLLIIDETHSISAGPGGYTQLAGLQPDMLVIGKPIAGGSSTSLERCCFD
jgi:hypothetical protein